MCSRKQQYPNSSRTWPPSKMKMLHSFKTLGYGKLPATQCNIPEHQNLQHISAENHRHLQGVTIVEDMYSM